MAESCWVVLFKVRWLALIHLTGSLFVDSQCISDVFVIWICNPFENWSERTNWKGATFRMRWDAVKDGLPDLSTSCFRASPHNPSAASDLSTYSTTSLISNEEQFEDYGEGDDVDFTPSSPCPDDETGTFICTSSLAHIGKGQGLLSHSPKSQSHISLVTLIVIPHSPGMWYWYLESRVFLLAAAVFDETFRLFVSNECLQLI